MIFDRPTSAELVEAVSQFLEKQIKANLPDHLAFKTQIAINSPEKYIKFTII